MSLKYFFLFLIFIQPLRGENRWEPTEFVWNLGLASLCDEGLDKDPIAYFQGSIGTPRFDIDESSQVVWTRACFMKLFCSEVLPKLKKPIVLVIGDGDLSFPSQSISPFEMCQLIENKNILHIFAQNCDYRGESSKVSRFPIGIDFHTIAFKNLNIWDEKSTSKEQEAVLKGILSTLKPTDQRKLGAFVDFQLNDTMRSGDNQRYLEFGEDRTSIFNRIGCLKMIDYPECPMKRRELWQKKGEYAFSISPIGNGLDCHRTWEDLVLGCIVIVKTSPLDPLYEGLPVVIVTDWDEITEENMKKWLEQYKDAFTNPKYREKLTNTYWINKVRDELRK